jgi:hypothetical protein
VAQLYLKPDYNKPVQDVCLDFVRAYLDATHGSSWALLFLHDASGDMGFSIGLPSWAPRYHIPMEGIERGPDGKARADEKVFRGFVATETEDSGVLPELTDTSLRVLGVHIDTASLLSYQPSQSFLRTGEMSAVLLDFVRRHGPVYRTPCSEIPAATALFATLMRRIDGAYDFLEGLVLLESLAAAGSSVSGAADEEVSRLWQLISQVYRTSRPTTNSLLSSTNISSLKERVALVWSRALSRYKVLNIGRLFETGLGYLGIAPLGTLEGDEICVLKGFQYPVALRPVGNQYVFIGVCFVLGLMSGEARAFVDDGRASPKVFELK